MIEYFSLVENKNLPTPQNFDCQGPLIPEQNIPEMPWSYSIDDVIAFKAVNDTNSLIFTFAMPREDHIVARGSSNVNFLNYLLSYEGEGSLYQVLKAMKLVDGIDLQEDTSQATVCQIVTIEFSISDEGLKQFELVEAIFF